MLRPTEFLIFGNAKGGTPLMPSQRHGLGSEVEPPVKIMTAVLSVVTRMAAGNI